MRIFLNSIWVLLCAVLLFGCTKDDLSDVVQPEKEVGLATETSFRKKPTGAGNNLSYPVVWAEGVPKPLRGTPGMQPILQGDFWWWWGIEGTDPNTTIIYSCLGDPDFPNEPTCLVEPETPEDNGQLVMVYPQKDPLNTWQAWNGTLPGVVDVDEIDWGDNLESVDWYLKSKVRTEVVLYKYNTTGTPWLEYDMRHVEGWGISELHGLAYDQTQSTPLTGPGDKGTIYSHCARFTMQKLDVTDLTSPENQEALNALTWVPEVGWEGDVINAPFFNKAVWEGGDGPGYYSAEINIKGRIIYGYTWDVKKLNQGAGYYRLTFSFDPTAGPAGPQSNTLIDDKTIVLVPIETTESTEGGGGNAVLRPELNLTYMDIQILGSTPGGGGNSPGGGPGNGGGGGNGPGGGGH